PDALSKARAYHRIGEVHRLAGRFDLAVEAYRDCYWLADRMGRLDLTSSALFGIGMTRLFMGDIRRAARWFRDGQLLLMRHGCHLFQGPSLAGRAACEALEGDRQAAQATLLDALEQLDGREDVHRDIGIVCAMAHRAAASTGITALAEQSARLAHRHLRVMDPERTLSGRFGDPDPDLSRY
ncbi:MAG: tetratricopeptide repeat protein, partial [Persicimonas sp.]